MAELPPSDPVALAALLAVPELGLRRLAGPADADVHGVHASEMADPSPYLLGGELLLTAGAELGGDPEAYVARLVAAGAAGLGFGVAPVHEEVPAGLVAACARQGLALLEVPQPTPFTAVARTVWRLMAEARTRELRRVAEAQQSLAAAASRPDPVPAVLARLAAVLHGHVLLTAPDGGRRTAGRAVPDEVAAALDALTGRPAVPGPATATDTRAGWQLSAYALGRPADDARGAVLALAAPARAPGDHALASAAAVLLALLTAPRAAGAGAEGAALTRLLLDGSPAEAAAALGPGPWTVVHALPAGVRDPAPLAAALGTALMDAEAARPVVRLIVAGEPGPQPGWTLGLSAPSALAEPAVADAQAARALRRARGARTALARHSAGAGIDALVDGAEARAHAAAVLAPLGPDLAETLRTWLAQHGSWDRTATALGVHRNTVRQRIARCAALLGADLDDPDVRMELWFALRHAEAAGPS
ncbi:helix-turn-helix domain-containing protein [Streptomyces sp. NPDC002073]